jgi:hypothetical protein
MTFEQCVALIKSLSATEIDGPGQITVSVYRGGVLRDIVN